MKKRKAVFAVKYLYFCCASGTLCLCVCSARLLDILIFGLRLKMMKLWKKGCGFNENFNNADGDAFRDAENNLVVSYDVQFFSQHYSRLLCYLLKNVHNEQI